LTCFGFMAALCGTARGLPVRRMPTPRDVPRNALGLVGMALRHKVAADLLAGLGAAGLSLDPAAVAVLRRNVAEDRLVRGLLLADWPALVGVIEGAGVRVLTLKGPASSIQLYGNPAARGYTDLDLLVDGDPDPLVPTLAAIGYLPIDPSPRPRAGAGDRFVQAGRHVSFQRRDRPFHVEVHGKAWLADELVYPIDTAALFERAERLEYTGRLFLAPSLVDHAVFMVDHGCRHAWCLLHWVLDMAVLLSRHDLAPLLAERITELGMERRLALAVDVARWLYPSAIHPALREMTDQSARGTSAALRFAKGMLLPGGRTHSSRINILRQALVYDPSFARNAKQRRKLRLRLFRIQRVDADRLGLPPALFFVNVVLRPVFILYRMVARALGYDPVRRR